MRRDVLEMMRFVLFGSLLLFACDQTPLPALPGSTAPPGAPTAAVTSSPAASVLADCEHASAQAAEAFVDRFNNRDLGAVTALFTLDARTYWLRRGDSQTDGFKEGGRDMIRKMIEVRMTDGELLAYDRIERNPSPPQMHYEAGSGQLWVLPIVVGLRGTFPDGTVRALGTKFVYACGQGGIVQLLILAAS